MLFLILISIITFKNDTKLWKPSFLHNIFTAAVETYRIKPYFHIQGKADWNDIQYTTNEIFVSGRKQHVLIPEYKECFIISKYF